MTILSMRIACWIPKTTNTHSEYVTIIFFPLQQWLHERASMLPYTYIAGLFFLRGTQHYVANVVIGRLAILSSSLRGAVP